MNTILFLNTLLLGLIFSFSGACFVKGAPKLPSGLRGRTIRIRSGFVRPSTPCRHALVQWSKMPGFAAILFLATLNSPVAAAASYTFSVPYAWWSYSAPYNNSLETEVQIINDPGASAPYFMANQFGIVDQYGALLSGGYIGLQTQVSGLEGKGKGIMFSLFDSANFFTYGGIFDHDPSYGDCRPFGNEGTGFQCFISYPWEASKRYRFDLGVGYTNGGYGYTASVTDLSTNPSVKTLIATILTTEQTYLGYYSVQWLEYYGAPPASCADYPYLKVLWSPSLGDQGATVGGGTELGNAYCRNSNVWNSGSDRYQEVGTPGGWLTTRSIQASSGYYLSATYTNSAGCGGSGVSVNSTTIGACEGFTRIPLGNGNVAWQTEDGYRLTCTGGGGSSVNATARTISNKETFKEGSLTYQGRHAFTYRTASGYYLTSPSQSSRNRTLTCNSRQAGTSQLFFVNPAP